MVYLQSAFSYDALNVAFVKRKIHIYRSYTAFLLYVSAYGCTKLELREKEDVQISQGYGFSPVWVLHMSYQI